MNNPTWVRILHDAHCRNSSNVEHLVANERAASSSLVSCTTKRVSLIGKAAVLKTAVSSRGGLWVRPPHPLHIALFRTLHIFIGNNNMEKYKKYCSKCNKEKSADEFHINSKNKKDGLSSWCKICQKEHKKQDYIKNKSRYIETFKRNTKWWFDIKKNLKCERCGFNHPAALDFHHKDPYQKEFILGGRNSYKKNETKILKEMEKCEVLCSNCHRIEHASWYNEYLEKEK